MGKPVIETDYLIVGAGATAMAFADTLLGESDARIVMVDRHHRPGGHWNDAYPFVRLHQPSAFYGVDSRPLGSGSVDAVGLNKGLHELSSGFEILDYYEQVMNQRFLPSGRLRYFPMCSYARTPAGRHGFTSLVGGTDYVVEVHGKVVDATHARTEVPSTHPPRYRIAHGVRCVSPNDLPKIGRAAAGYTVVGGGKTGIDACLWLLQNGADPACIQWIMPRDSWFQDRANIQPGGVLEAMTIQFECIAAAASLRDLFERLEERGQLLRLDPSVQPDRYRGATVSRVELEELRRIQDVVRLGRIEAIESDRILLERGRLPTSPDRLHIDCSANAIPVPPPMRIFDGDRINLLCLRAGQPVFSAALIACVECRVADESDRNAMCRPIPPPENATDWLAMWPATLANRQGWGRHEGVAGWLARSRLNGGGASAHGTQESGPDRRATLGRLRAAMGSAAQRLPSLVAGIG